MALASKIIQYSLEHPRRTTLAVVIATLAAWGTDETLA